MKLVIHYDVIDAILNVNEGINVFKTVRNNKKKLAFISPFCFSFGYLVHKSIPESLATVLLMIIYGVGKTTLEQQILGFDVFKNKSSNDLKKLVSQLKEYLYLDTSYDLLLDSELVEKKYNISFDKENLLSVMESKYILVPTYDFLGNVKNTSLLQEHNIGSNDYILSVGSPKKELKLAYSNI